MRILFMGSPPFAVPSLRALASNYNLIGVVTQPDRPAGRGRALHSSAVKVLAQELNIKILQPTSLRNDDPIHQLQELQPDLIIVAAYGQILPERVLDIPSFGCLNIHASLLPRWRGAAPIQAAILHGDEVTGVTIMLMEAGLDTGPILSQKSIEIQSHETAGELSNRLSAIGANLLMETLPGYLRGDIAPIPQDNRLATHAAMIKKSDGALDFNTSALQLVRQVRAFEPWPTSYFHWNNQRIVVKKASSIPNKGMEPGLVVLFDPYPAVTTTDGLFILEHIQPAGKKEMSGDAFLRGSSEFIGSSLSDSASLFQ